MLNEMDFAIILILSVVFSPVIVGLTALFFIKSRQARNMPSKPKGTFQEMFGFE